MRKGATFFKQESQGDDGWIFYTVIAACVLIILIILVVLYDLCVRCRNYQGHQEILDGGAPISPGHQYSYSMTICLEEASPSFDPRQSVIKMDLLDHMNQYITSIVVPCFVFKLKNMVPGQKSLTSHDLSPLPSKLAAGQQQADQAASRPNWLNTKSMAALVETWANTPKSSIVSFTLIKRNPLTNLTSIRVSHDCYKPNALLLIKYIQLKDDQTLQRARADLADKPIRAVHPCPPSGVQVFKLEPQKE